MNYRVCVVVAAMMLSFLPAAAQVKHGSSLHFRDIGPQSGLTTVPHSAPVKQYLVEMMGGGVALFDCDNDGKLDIVTVTDSTVDTYLHGGELMVTLYHQDTPPNGAIHFTDTTVSSGLTTHGWGMGVAVGDFDNDGLPDLYVTGYGHNVLYRNLGGCKFEDVTAQKKVGGGGFSVGAAWADYDRDGKLDLFVSRYVDTDLQHLPKPGDKAFQYQGLPMEVPVLKGETDLLFHNSGAGVFEDLSQKAGVGNPDKRLGMGVIWSDYDHDGWPDLFVANDMGPNFLYHNKHDGTFEEVGLISGTALSGEGRSMGNMAADFADYDRKGALDLVVTRYGYQPMSLYKNEGDLGFADKAFEAGLAQSGDQLVAWGAGFADFDNDGWPDLFVANGNVSSMVDKLPHDLKYREPIQLFHNLRNGSFVEVANVAGLNDGPLHSRRGTAFGDINNDGKMDVVVYNVGGPPSLFLNESKSNNHSVLLKLAGRKSNRSAIGARVTVTAGQLVQTDEVRGGGSYLSSNDQRLHFGLGAETVIKNLKIDWPSGLTENLPNVAADNLYSVVEGSGIQQTIKLTTPGVTPVNGAASQTPQVNKNIAKSLEIENNIPRKRGLIMPAAAAALVLPRIAGYDFEIGANLGNPSERTHLSSAAIRAFINIARNWKLTEEQSRALLGGLASSTFHAWKSNPKRTLDQDTLIRISLLIGIYKALNIYFGKPWADRWVTLENRGTLFAGRTPLAFMIQRGQPGMVEVRRMLDMWRGGR